MQNRTIWETDAAGWAFPPGRSPSPERARLLLRGLISPTRQRAEYVLPCGRFEIRRQGAVAQILDLKRNKLVGVMRWMGRTGRGSAGREPYWGVFAADGSELAKLSASFVAKWCPADDRKPVTYDAFAEWVATVMDGILCPVCKDEYGETSDECSDRVVDDIILSYVQLRRLGSSKKNA